MKIHVGSGKGGASQLGLDGVVLQEVSSSTATLSSLHVDLLEIKGVLVDIRALLREQADETRELKLEARLLKEQTREATDAVRADTENRNRSRNP